MSSVSGPVWLDSRILLGLNEQVLRGTDESPGVRGGGIVRLEEALTRPEARYRFENVCGIPYLAAYYAGAITGKHPFHGGNKRTSLAAAGTFMYLNGLDIEAQLPPTEQGEEFDDEAYERIVALSTGNITVRDFGDWLALQSIPCEEGEKAESAEV
ncbi:type II toxin-antitoxin system death-on-curing family toxin [Salinibacter sp.]|uniref:type II toxin-antitoxin system death-on-curing family toxin n=1 Tax=Salinibacter sp. TaxID=2065818 RepID=UPI0021E88CD8|nr:Fic family protein [Salinibacter sp.]